MATLNQVRAAYKNYKKTLKKSRSYSERKASLPEAIALKEEMAKIEKMARYNHHPYGYELGDDADYPTPHELPEYRLMYQRYNEIVDKHAPKIKSPSFQLRNGKMVPIDSEKIIKLLRRIRRPTNG